MKKEMLKKSDFVVFILFVLSILFVTVLTTHYISIFKWADEGYYLETNLYLIGLMMFFIFAFIFAALMAFVFYESVIKKRDDSKSTIRLKISSVLFVMSTIIFTYLISPTIQNNGLFLYLSSNSYDYLNMMTKNSFGRSDLGKSMNTFIVNNDIESLKILLKNKYKNDFMGLTDDAAFTKLMIVNSLSDQSIKDEFKKIYADRYITLNEYNEFKSKSIVTLTQSLNSSYAELLRQDNYKFAQF